MKTNKMTNQSKPSRFFMPITIGAVLVIALALAIVSNLEKNNSSYQQELPVSQNNADDDNQGSVNTANTSNNSTANNSGSGSGSASSFICVDGDNGLNYYVGAYVTLLEQDGTLVNKSADSCVSGNNQALVEYYCDGGMVKLKQTECYNHCLEGACVPSYGGGGGGGPTGPACGNGVCESGEPDGTGCYDPTSDRVCVPGSCPGDCEPKPTCGNKVCEKGEAGDCPACYFTGQCQLFRECNEGTCPSDCFDTCGNKVCDKGEEDSRGCWDPTTRQVCIPGSCDSDCVHPPVCGNKVCEENEADSKGCWDPNTDQVCIPGTCSSDCPALSTSGK